MSTEAEGWSRDYGPGPSLSCPRACYGRSVGTRSQTGLGLRRETWVSSSGSRSCGRQGWGATKAAAGGTQRGVSPHCCPSQTPCPSTQRMPPCRRLKTQCPEERSLEMPASSRQVQAGDPLPSHQTWSGLGKRLPEPMYTCPSHYVHLNPSPYCFLLPTALLPL